jgi:DNA-binding NarL/FixJ family response regulator/anti-sigma regulatory factor (Ser/Thr protein kinase)
LERAADPVARQLALEISDLISDSIETSRSLTAELSPPILRVGGLVPALEWLAGWMQEKQGLAVRVEAQGRVGLMAEDVTALLFQATRELLFNVVKHAGVKAARVQVHRLDGRVHVIVADEGAGFDPAQLRAVGGPSAGFGLFSIRERLDLLGGRMEIHSAPGRGSRFTLVAPASAPTSQEARDDRPPQASVVISVPGEAAAARESRIRVVLVDDHIVMRQGLSMLLRGQPDIAVVGEASDGESAVGLVRQLRPDVVLMDVSLPGMNGIEATRIIRAEMPAVHVIGLSMFEGPGREDSMREAGAVSYLAKSGPSLAVVAAIRACARPVPHQVKPQPQTARAKAPDKKPQARRPARRGSRILPEGGSARKPTRRSAPKRRGR